MGELAASRAAPTVSDLCDRFIDEYLPRLRPTTQREYRRIIKTVIRPVLGKRKVAEIDFADIDALHRGITRRGRIFQANRTVALASRMFTLAMKWRMRTDNPAKGVERNQEHKRERYLSTAELTRLAEALPTLRDQQGANVIRLALLTGARRGELLKARWVDFDLATAT